MSKTRKQTEPKVKFQITITALENGKIISNIKGTRIPAEVIGVLELTKLTLLNEHINPKP